MKITFPFLDRKKIAVHTILVLLMISAIAHINKLFPFYYLSSIRFKTYMLLTVFGLFYIHILVLLPILFIEKKMKKYLLFTSLCILLFSVVEIYFGWLYIHSDARSLSPIFGITMHSFSTEQVVRIFITLLFPIIIIILVSFNYALLFFEKKKTTIYLEFILNVVFLFVIGIFILKISNSLGNEIVIICIVITLFYINTFFVSPIIIKEHKRLKYVLWLIILCVSFYLLIIVSVGYPKFDSETGEKITEPINEVISTYISLLFITLILSFIYSYLRIRLKKKEQSFSIKLDSKESELQLLKSQVNPHFLFNTLNTLYATALKENAPKTAESTAKLANLLRYMQNDISKDFIPLQNEINYLKDYIIIQKLRCAVEPKIATTFENVTNQSISPGLLIPFVENAFKYGIDPSKKSELSISIICHESTIHFTCTNTYSDNFKVNQTEEGFGIGIKNAKQRLELVYPTQHTFEIEKESNIFSVYISIKTVKLN